jgi:hypothetical protein
LLKSRIKAGIKRVSDNYSHRNSACLTPAALLPHSILAEVGHAVALRAARPVSSQSAYEIGYCRLVDFDSAPA